MIVLRVILFAACSIVAVAAMFGVLWFWAGVSYYRDLRRERLLCKLPVVITTQNLKESWWEFIGYGSICVAAFAIVYILAARLL